MSIDISRMRSRSLILWMAGFVLAVLAFNQLLHPSPEWLEVGMGASFYGMLFLWVWRQCGKAHLSLRDLVGPGFGPFRIGRVFLITIMLLVVGEGCLWLFWMPISYVLPEFTVEWALTSYPPHWNSETPVPSMLNILLTVLAGPVIEELVFRGVLLQRWAVKWGAWTALTASSVLFGVLHSDVLGSIVFGYVLGFLASRTGGLRIPIAVHILNNGIAVALEFAPGWTYLPNELDAFRNLWPWGLLCLIVGCFFLHRFWSFYQPRKPLAFPLDATPCADAAIPEVAH